MPRLLYSGPYFCYRPWSSSTGLYPRARDLAFAHWACRSLNIAIVSVDYRLKAFGFPLPNSRTRRMNTPAVNHVPGLGHWIQRHDDLHTSNTHPACLPEELIVYWLSFVRAGDPNKFKLPRSPEWPQYARTSKQRIVLQQDRGHSTRRSGSFVALEPANESRRCEVVAC
ncbi:hypothetical protein PM082_015608 [Marasmius tenuissimus]|nr:hypothetical protein PM082_015608 [Marasmius tenuissimus]